MAKFTVKCVELVPVTVEVEADSQDDADDVAADGGGDVVSSGAACRITNPNTDGDDLKGLVRSLMGIED